MKTNTRFLSFAALGLALWGRPVAAGVGTHCYVAESGTGTIYDYAPDGARTVYATNMGWCFGLAFDSATNLYVADRDSYIYKISPSGTNSQFVWLPNGPCGLAVDRSDNLYVGMFGNGYIYKYAPDGTRTTYGKEPEDGYGNAGRPTGLAFNQAGNLFETDEYNGLLFKNVPAASYAGAPGGPWGLAFDSRSNLFVTASLVGKIYKYANLGGNPSTVYTTFATNLSNPLGVACDRSNNVYVADYLAGKIYRYDTNGTQTVFASGLQSPTAVAFAPAAEVVTPPALRVTRSGSGVLVSWPNTGNFTLLENSNLANANGWTTNTAPVTTANGTNSITLTAPTGNRFYRLSQ